MNYQETIEYIFSALPMFHRIGPAAYKANLDNTIALCDLVGNPERNLTCIHIAGTNGKGSTSNMLASILQEEGYKVGLYSSPHLKDFRERIRVNGSMVEEQWVANFVTKYKYDFDVIKPSFFEMSTIMAFKYFNECKTDICIIETGLGGRLDSTNVVTPLVSVITNISFDHMNLLGDTLSKIAIEKAGIIKSGIPVVIGEHQKSVINVFQEKAASLNADISIADQEWEISTKDYSAQKSEMSIHTRRKSNLVANEYNVALSGSYQVKNCATVLEVIYQLNRKSFVVSANSITKGFKNVSTNTGFRGRWQILGRDPLIICDTGHNEDGIKYVMSLLNTISKNKLHFVLGMVEDKEVEKILNLLSNEAIYYFCKANIPRGMNAEILAIKAKLFGLSGNIFPSVLDAFNDAKKNAKKEDVIFIGGSTFTVAEII